MNNAMKKCNEEIVGCDPYKKVGVTSSKWTSGMTNKSGLKNVWDDQAHLPSRKWMTNKQPNNP